MEKIKFTRSVRQKLRSLGWERRADEDVVKSGYGLYTKQVGKVYISLMIRNHYIQRFQCSVNMQSDKLDFAFDMADDFKEAVKELRRLNYFEY